MADTAANITLTTSGGSEAAAETQKASDALDSVTESSGGMESAFARRFQHVGLMLFAGDLLRANGLGAEARMIISTLGMAITTAAGAFGLASGPVMLVVTALTALVGIMAKVISKNEETIASLDKQMEANKSLVESTSKQIHTIEEYGQVLGKVPDWLERVEKADMEERNQALLSQKLKLQGEIALLQAQIAGHETKWQLFKDEFGWGKESQMDLKTRADLSKKLADAVSYLTEINKGNIKSIEEQVTEGKKLQAEQEKGADAGKKAMEDALKEELQKSHQFFQAQMLWTNELKNTSEQAFKSISSGFGNAIGAMVVEGQSLSQSMDQVFTKMAESFIGQVTEMIVVWAALKALMMISPGGAAAFQGMATAAFPQIAANVYGSSVPKMASGGTMIADQPTLAVFGEAGPEMATFSPMGGGRSSGGGGDTYNINLQTHVYGVTDPKQIADQIGPLIVQNIRGRGNIGFVRNA